MHEFSVCQFPNAFHPQGWQYLRNVEIGETVRWSYNVDGVSIIKEVQMPWNLNAIGIRYRIDPGDARLNCDSLLSSPCGISMHSAAAARMISKPSPAPMMSPSAPG